MFRWKDRILKGFPVGKILADARYTIEENNEEIKEAKREVYKAIL